MIEDMLTCQTKRWQAALAARARIYQARRVQPRSAVPALDEWLAPFRERPEGKYAPIEPKWRGT
jgi:hypothetical protein